MMHTKQIREIVDEGRHDDAHLALDRLLALGPKNTEALKLKALLLEYEGRLADAERVWVDVLRIDDDDVEAQEAFLERHVEEREHFYFTDELQDGGRRYLAYPREIINRSLLGLLGCVLFLLQVKLSYRWPVLGSASALIPAFFVLIVAPWAGILWSFFTALQSVTMNRFGIAVKSRVRQWTCGWQDLADVAMVRSHPESSRPLTLVLVPQAPEEPVIEIDMSAATTPIRGRTVFSRELVRMGREPRHITKENLDLAGRRLRRY